MLTRQKVIDAINEQIGYEFSASLQYYAIAAHFAAEALPQLSQHFFRQADEEKGHALRFIKYVVDAGGRVVIPAIDAPESKFKVPRDAVKLSLDQEIHVTNQINGLVELARKENDYITINFLQWFLTEQLEEVSSPLILSPGKVGRASLFRQFRRVNEGHKEHSRVAAGRLIADARLIG